MSSEDPLSRWHLQPSSNREYDFMDGLRGVAILLVIFCHLVYAKPETTGLPRFLVQLVQTGGNGVPLFFVLSGFLISLPFWRRKKEGLSTIPPGYGMRRFFKIYPPLALSILLLAPIYYLRDQNPIYLPLTLKWLIGYPLFFPISGKMNSVMWSLIVEVQFYITLPVLILLCRRISFNRCLWLIPLFLFGFGLARRLFSESLGAQVYSEFTKLNYPFPSDLDMFAFGVLVAGLQSGGYLKPRHLSLGYIGLFVFAAMLIIMAWALFKRADVAQIELLGIGIKVGAGLILFFIVDTSCLAARLLCHPVLRFLGIVSYEWYLLHQPFFLWARHVFGPANGHASRYALILIGPFLFTLLLATLMYRFYSLPILRYGRSRARR